MALIKVISNSVGAQLKEARENLLDDDVAARPDGGGGLRQIAPSVMQMVAALDRRSGQERQPCPQ